MNYLQLIPRLSATRNGDFFTKKTANSQAYNMEQSVCYLSIINRPQRGPVHFRGLANLFQRETTRACYVSSSSTVMVIKDNS